ncbi:MAG: hypothetical protein ACLQDV_00660 [Candidatus Binataceae bacterium]
MNAESIDRIPPTHAGQQLAWYLRILASPGPEFVADEKQRFVPDLIRQYYSSRSDEERFEGWKSFSANIGAFEIISVDEATDAAASITLKGAKDRRWRLSCSVEEQPPHRIAALNWQRIYDFDVSAREAVEADGPALSEVERRCPIALGDKSIAIDRGEDYFAFSRLMEDPAVGIAFVDGAPAAAICWALHRVRVGGIEHPVLTGVHLRVLPEHQRKGLWGAANKILEKFAGKYDATRAFPSANNAAMLHGFRDTPNRWSLHAMRAQLPCASIAGPRAGRTAARADAARIVEILNTTHDSEEMYLHYTVDSLVARLERAPKQYSWDRMWMTDRAVVGVWPAGDTIRYLIESSGERTESRRGLVLDYGFLPGAEDEFEALLHGWCGWLADRGSDLLSIFTSEKSPGYETLRKLSGEMEAIALFTPGVAEPPDASQRGFYIDAIYF